MFSSLTIFFYRKVVIAKMRKLKIRESHWLADKAYNQAVDDCIRVILDTGNND